MNFCAIQTFRISFFLTVIVCFVQCLAEGQSSSKHLKHGAHFLYPNDLVRLSGADKKECVHDNTTYGKREPGDLQTFVEIVKKSKSMIRKTTVEVTHPSSGKSKNNCIITEIQIGNLNKECGCFGEEIKFNGGGPGAQHFNLSITSGRNCPNYHKVSCYAKC